MPPKSLPGRRDLNRAFSRFVNDRLTAKGQQASSDRMVGRVTRVGWGRFLMWNMSENWSKKPLSGNILRRFATVRLENACPDELGSVNHSSLVFRIGLFQGVLKRPPVRRADLSPKRRGRGLACAYC